MIRVVPVLLLYLSSCHGGDNPRVQQVVISDSTAAITETSGDTIAVDLAQSKIRWKGTKMRGAGKHEGEIQLMKAYFLSQGQQLTGGGFTADMRSIQVTDIPVHEPVPRKRLNDHLKSDDFFHTRQFPTSHFDITHVEYFSADSLLVQGNLTIKDITRNIEFISTFQDSQFTAKFLFDRFQWDIAYTGNWIDKTLVDRDIELRVRIRIK